jgi:putative DNA primase/helicase
MGYARSAAADTARALADRAEDVAVALLGRPSSRSRRDMRWGSRGSLWCCTAGQDRGRWHDHEAGRGGDLLDLIAGVYGVSLVEAIDVANSRFLGGVPQAQRQQCRSPRRR